VNIMSKSDQYEGVAESYDQTFKLLPYREHVEAYTLYKLLGDLSGRSVLDLASGTGIFTRAIRRWGAERVAGVDLSEDMVRLARSHEEENPLGGIEYVIGDVADLDSLGRFDVAVGIYLVGYAASREDIVRMGRGVARNLAPGGRFITYFLNPDACRTPGYYNRNGIELYFEDNVGDGDSFHFQLFMGETSTPKLHNYFWSREPVASALEEAGFTDLRWVQPELSEQGLAEHGPGYWEDYLRCVHGIFLECTKA
jgi:SAM-dependent methyltransferase